jgi:hypothetical protein
MPLCGGAVRCVNRCSKRANTKILEGHWCAKTRLRRAEIRSHYRGDASHPSAGRISYVPDYYLSVSTHSAFVSRLQSMYTSTFIIPCDIPPKHHCPDSAIHTCIKPEASARAAPRRRVITQRLNYVDSIKPQGIILPSQQKRIQNNAPVLIHALWSGVSNSAPNLTVRENFCIFRSRSHPESCRNGKPGYCCRRLSLLSALSDMLMCFHLCSHASPDIQPHLPSSPPVPPTPSPQALSFSQPNHAHPAPPSLPHLP